MGRKMTNKGSGLEDPRTEYLWFLMRMAVHDATCAKLGVDVLPEKSSPKLVSRLKKIPGVVNPTSR